MKRILALVLTAGVLGSAAAQPRVGVSIGIQQPGVYGQIHIGDLPPPALVRPEPVYVGRVRSGVAPMYIYAPEVQQRRWHRHCQAYNACGRPVYFVREDWVQERYSREHPGWDRGKGHGNGNGRGHDREHRRDHEHGPRWER